jgi:hypothetical protein
MGVSWKDRPGAAREIEPRLVVLDLSPLERGWYTLELSAGVGGDERATIIRRIEVIRR